MSYIRYCAIINLHGYSIQSFYLATCSAMNGCYCVTFSLDGDVFVGAEGGFDMCLYVWSNKCAGVSVPW